MAGFRPLLLIALILIAGCLAPAPKETPATTPATGSVEVSSTPPGAGVYLDNVYQGTTPVTIIDAAGPHTIELRLRDYQSWSKTIVIEKGSRTSVDASLAPVPVMTSPPATDVTTRPATMPTTRPRPTTTPTTVPTTTPWPRLILGCFLFETDSRTTKGEILHLTEVWWFQPAGVGLINDTWTYQSAHRPDVSLTGFTWVRDPKTDLVAVTIVGQGTPAEVHYNGNNDTITFSNRNMRPTIFPRVACWM